MCGRGLFWPAVLCFGVNVPQIVNFQHVTVLGNWLKKWLLEEVCQCISLFTHKSSQGMQVGGGGGGRGGRGGGGWL